MSLMKSKHYKQLCNTFGHVKDYTYMNNYKPSSINISCTTKQGNKLRPSIPIISHILTHLTQAAQDGPKMPPVSPGGASHPIGRLKPEMFI